MFDLGTFGLTDVLECSSALRHMGEGHRSMESAAGAVVSYLYEHLLDKESDERALALVRLYKTHRYEELDDAARRFVAAEAVPSDSSLPCLTLLATAGDEPAWNDRIRSQGHLAIPMPSAAAVEQSPMVSQLIRELGIELDDVVRPEPGLFRRIEGPCGVFYVPEAQGSPYVPAQNGFVERYGIRSVLGFGGVLPSGYVFAVVMFSKVAVPPETADAIATLAFAVNLALLPFVEGRVFEADGRGIVPGPERELRVAKAEAVALGHLLDVRHRVVLEQSMRLEQARQAAQEHAEALIRSQQKLIESESRKAAILDAALDSIITIDAGGHIVDFNPAAERTFGYTRAEAVGRRLSELIIPAEYREAHEEGLSRYARTGEGPILGQRLEITAVRRDGAQFPVELTVTAVESSAAPVFTGYLRDITHRVAAEHALREAGERSAHIARTLQASLLPPELPDIPGIEVASAYRPMTTGLEVGGDFYDIFEIGKDDWAAVLGDVMGKGTEAAALTALARYTVRAGAIRARRPAAVLGLLNDAIHRNDPERFATAVYTRIRVGSTSRITVASGGHLPPLLRSAAGDVTALATPGTLLGPFRPWDGKERKVSLHPGDLMFLYSDGVVEGRNGRDTFGTDRLIEVLRSERSTTAAGAVAAVMDTVTSFSDSASDDIAILALRQLPSPA